MIYQLCDLLKISNSLNDYIWDDLIDWKNPTKLCVHYPNRIIEGYIHFTENYSNVPSLSLAGYVIKDSSGQILIDNRHTENKVIFIELDKSEYVEIEYYDKSSMCIDIKTLASNNH
ncbi:hypothetical protein [Clostridium sp. AM58-1XD]|uniref:hypothetical protein n=1 Tax=Clostridium sp. AM58-1XD TaxID=2292307 RepID=UPI000E4B2921|nr:hypothetical protein [Clostridium sp. AM58-1XD]RGY98605.1 hypothetical protein DXA13_11040 [Clostridium sp. AM58-1XD]